jgi:hypothetical protein
MVFRSHPIGACCVRSGRLRGFIPQKLAHFEEHILTLHMHTARSKAKVAPIKREVLPSNFQCFMILIPHFTFSF